jgi:peroxiredoxin
MAEKYDEAQDLRKMLREIKDDEDSIRTYREQLRTVEGATQEYKLDFIKKRPDNLLSKIFNASRTPDIPESPMLPNGRVDSTFPFRYYKSHFFDLVDFKDDRLIRTPVFHEKVKTYLDRLTTKHPDSVIVAADLMLGKTDTGSEVFKYLLITMLNDYAASKIMCMDAVYAHLVDNYYAKGMASWIDTVSLYRMKERAKVMNYTLCDKKAWNFVLRDQNQKYVSLNQVKADLTVLVFWDPDCGHCKKAVPLIKKELAPFEGKSLEVVAVNTEDDLKKWHKFIEDKGLGDWIHLEDSARRSNFRYVYDISSTPKIYILDDEKRIIGKRLSHEQIAGFIEDRFKAIEEEKKPKSAGKP